MVIRVVWRSEKTIDITTGSKHVYMLSVLNMMYFLKQRKQASICIHLKQDVKFCSRRNICKKSIHIVRISARVYMCFKSNEISTQVLGDSGGF